MGAVIPPETGDQVTDGVMIRMQGQPMHSFYAFYDGIAQLRESLQGHTF